ncbi:hypothetical protein HBI47_093680 [Parastagonospora nodorum]|nr:hypothetical protein HBI47_093680 [Parastagonospora nodorum]
MMQRKQYYRRLGLQSNATEADIRAAYETLALQQHPDKAIDSDREKATKNFQKLQEAYEFCLFCAEAQILGVDDEGHAEDDVDDQDDSDWRGQLPHGVGGTGSWWKELSGDEPAPVRRWAEVSEKAVRNAPFLSSMSKIERNLLNKEYSAAYQCFELWRQKYIEKLDQGDKLQHSINNLPERQASHARVALDNHRSSSDYEYKTGYEDEVDEEAFFGPPFGDQIPSKLTYTWRNNHNVALKIAPQKRLAQFQRQVAATESRGALPYHTKAEERRREKNRAASATALVANVKLAEQGHGRNQAGELFLHQGASAQRSSSTAAHLLKDEDEPVDFQRGTGG